MSQLAQQIHERALELSAHYKKVEGDLLEILDKVDRHRVYLKQGHSSLFFYVVRELGLSESVTYNLITVLRKAREVPELKSLVEQGAITLSNARKITPVLTAQNKSHWLEKAASLSNRQLDKEVAKARPQSAVHENASYVSGTRVKLEVGLSEKDMLNLRRVQDLLCQARGRPVTLGEVIAHMTSEHLERHDPVARAKRQIVKKGVLKPPKPVTLQETSRKRIPIPANLLHQVRLRDQGRCTHTIKGGQRCNQSRWVEVHHKTPVSLGGENTLENLATFCKVHHAWIHRSEV